MDFKTPGRYGYALVPIFCCSARQISVSFKITRGLLLLKLLKKLKTLLAITKINLYGYSSTFAAMIFQRERNFLESPGRFIKYCKLKIPGVDT